jgi:phosphoribosyl-AMP cyclohydrolase
VTHAIYELAVIDQLLADIKFDADGLVAAIAQDVHSGQVLMLAWMNAESLRLTMQTGNVTYWSRSRQELWRKGATSGHIQALHNVALDCDGDALLLQIKQTGAACHTGAISCFFRDMVKANS